MDGSETTRTDISATGARVGDQFDEAEAKGIMMVLSAIRKGIFGTAFVMAKDAGGASPRITLLFMAIELFQLVSFPLGMLADVPGLEPMFVATDWITVGAFNNFVNSYGFIFILVVVTGIVGSFLCLTAAVASRFVTDSMQSRGMLRALRLLTNLSTSVFFIPFCGVMMQSFHCNGGTDPSSGLWMNTAVECGSAVHRLIGSLMGIMLTLFTLLSVFLAATYVNTDPTSPSWSAKVHGRLDVVVIGMKLLITLVWGMTGNARDPTAANIPSGAFLLALSGGWLALHWVTVPYIHMRMNGLVAAEAACFAWCSIAAMIHLLVPQAQLDPTLMVLLGTPAVAVAVFLAFNHRIQTIASTPRASVRQSPMALELWARVRLRNLLTHPAFGEFLQQSNGSRGGEKAECLSVSLKAWREELFAQRQRAWREELRAHNAEASGGKDLTRREPSHEGNRAAGVPNRAGGGAPPKLVGTGSMRRLASKPAGKLQRPGGGGGGHAASIRLASGTEGTNAGGIAAPHGSGAGGGDDEVDPDAEAQAHGEALERRRRLASIELVLAGMQQAVEAYTNLATQFVTSELALTLAASFLQAYSPFQYGELLALHRATLLNPAIDTQFIVFRRVRQLQLHSKSGSADNGEHSGRQSSVVDRVLVEQHMRQIHQLRRSAYKVTARMWNALAAKVADLGQVAHHGRRLQSELRQLESLYKTVLRVDQSSTAMLRGYASFLRHQKRADDAAQELENKAERIEEAHLRRRTRTLRQVVFGMPLTAKLDQADESAAVVTVSGEPGSLGEISQVSLGACRLLQFRSAQQLLGTNISVAVPEPFRSHHDDYLRRFAVRQSSNLIGNAVCAFASTSSGSILPIWLQVNEAPPRSATAAPRFTAVMEPITTTEQHLFLGSAEDGFPILEASSGSISLLGITTESLRGADPVSATRFFPTLDMDRHSSARLVIGESSLKLWNDEAEFEPVEDFEPAELDQAGRAAEGGEDVGDTLQLSAETLRSLRHAALAELQRQHSAAAAFPGSSTPILSATREETQLGLAPVARNSSDDVILPVASSTSGRQPDSIVFGGLQRIQRGSSVCFLLRWRACSEVVRKHGGKLRPSHRLSGAALVKSAIAINRMSGGRSTTPTWSQVGSASVTPTAAGVQTRKAQPQADSAAHDGGSECDGDEHKERAGSADTFADENDEADGGSGRESLSASSSAPAAADSDGRMQPIEAVDAVQAGGVGAAVGGAAASGTDASLPDGVQLAGASATQLAGEDHAFAVRSGRSGGQAAVLRAGKRPSRGAVSFDVPEGSGSGARTPSVDTPGRRLSSGMTIDPHAQLATPTERLHSNGGANEGHASQGFRAQSVSSGSSANSSRLMATLDHQHNVRDPDVGRVKLVVIIVMMVVVLIGVGDLLWLWHTGFVLEHLTIGLLRSGDRITHTQRATAVLAELVAASSGLHGKLFPAVAEGRELFRGIMEDLQQANTDIYTAGDSYGVLAGRFEQSVPLLVVELSSETLGQHAQQEVDLAYNSTANVPGVPHAICPNISTCDPRGIAFAALGSVEFWMTEEELEHAKAIDPHYDDREDAAHTTFLPSDDPDVLRQQREYLDGLEAVADTVQLPLSQYGQYYTAMFKRLVAVEPEDLGYLSRDIRNVMANDGFLLHAANVSLQLRSQELISILPETQKQLVIAGAVSFFGILLLQSWSLAVFVSRIAARTRFMLRLMLLVPRKACKQAAHVSELNWNKLADEEMDSEEEKQRMLDAEAEMEEEDAAEGMRREQLRQETRQDAVASSDLDHRLLMAASHQPTAGQASVISAKGIMAESPGGLGRNVWARGSLVRLRPHTDTSSFFTKATARYTAPTILILLWIVFLFLGQLSSEHVLQGLAQRVVVMNMLGQSTLSFSTGLVELALASSPETREDARERIQEAEEEIHYLAEVGLFGGTLHFGATSLDVEVRALEAGSEAYRIYVQDMCSHSDEADTCLTVADGILAEGAYSGLLGLLALGRKLLSAVPDDDSHISIVFDDHAQVVHELTDAVHAVNPFLREATVAISLGLVEEMHERLGSLWRQSMWGTAVFASIFSIFAISSLVSANQLTLPLQSARLMLSQVPSGVRQTVGPLRQAVRDLVTEADLNVVNVKYDPSTTHMVSSNDGVCATLVSCNSRKQARVQPALRPHRQ